MCIRDSSLTDALHWQRILFNCHGYSITDAFQRTGLGPEAPLRALRRPPSPRHLPRQRSQTRHGPALRRGELEGCQ
eukprot:1909535-Rhodomonas_salina.2